MNHLLIRHRVADFPRWKTVYDAHAAARTQAGLKERDLWHDMADPSQIVLLYEVADVQKARDFCESADLREAMQKAGVTDQPDVYFLR